MWTGIQGHPGGHTRASKPFIPADFAESHPGREEEACEYYNKTMHSGNKRPTASEHKSPWAKMKEAVKGHSEEHESVEMRDVQEGEASAFGKDEKKM